MYMEQRDLSNRQLFNSKQLTIQDNNPLIQIPLNSYKEANAQQQMLVNFLKAYHLQKNSYCLNIKTK